MSDTTPLGQETLGYYGEGRESSRLRKDNGLIELARTRELLQRFVPPPPAVVLDIGGGAGVYAFWLAQQGYRVHLIDATPLHIEQAHRYSQAENIPLAEIAVGDARHLTQPDAVADAVLLLGPLYHLTERSDRLAALREAFRTLKPGGVLLAAAISRYASFLDGLLRGYLEDPVFAGIVRQDLTDGQHRNPTNHPRYFTTSFFHTPQELEAEAAEAGFENPQVLAIEGPGWMFPELTARWHEPARRELYLELMRQAENAPALTGASSHLMVVGRKPA
jgi:ubiquinone/menaquinone biosynthesis C-methylase UbiE